MKMLVPILAAALGAATPAFAVEEHHPEQEKKPEAVAPAKPADVGKTTERMKENLKKMEGQVEKIRKARDAKERDRLLSEHMQTMRDNMMMGQSMMEGGMGMMGGGMMGPGMMEQCMRMMGGMGMMGGGMGPEAMMGRMQQMEKRMDMMQMMMEQMLKSHGQPDPAR
jgi:hypothetical protein